VNFTIYSRTQRELLQNAFKISNTFTRGFHKNFYIRTDSSQKEVVENIIQNVPPEKVVGVEEVANQIVTTTDITPYQDFISYGILKTHPYWYEYPFIGVQFFLEYIQYLTGTPWWIVIVIASSVLRLLFLPFQIKQMRHTHNIAQISPQIKALSEKASARRSSSPFVENWTAIQKLYAANGIDMFKPFKYAFAQVPFFILLFVAIRQMCTRPEWLAELSSGGILFWTDLTALDSSYILPLLSGISILLTFEIQRYYSTIYNPNPPGFMYKWISRSFSLFIAFIATNFPMGINLYWLASTGLLTITTLILYQKPVKEYFGMHAAVSKKYRVIDLKKPKKTTIDT